MSDDRIGRSLDGQELTGSDLVDRAIAWPVTAERVLGAGTFTALLQDDVTAPDGTTLQREYLKHPGAVGIIALDGQVGWRWCGSTDTPSDIV